MSRRARCLEKTEVAMAVPPSRCDVPVFLLYGRSCRRSLRFRMLFDFCLGASPIVKCVQSTNRPDGYIHVVVTPSVIRFTLVRCSLTTVVCIFIVCIFIPTHVFCYRHSRPSSLHVNFFFGARIPCPLPWSPLIYWPTRPFFLYRHFAPLCRTVVSRKAEVVHFSQNSATRRSSSGGSAAGGMGVFRADSAGEEQLGEKICRQTEKENKRQRCGCECR